ncbi:MAG: hypothetical protein ABI643_03395 [Candidatus Doudnabacteria bacterium]
MRFWLSAIVCLLFCAIPCFAQDTDPQTRLVLHTTADLSTNWFVTNWIIGNIKADNPNNINIFPGIGYRGGKWWFEAMVQRQWSKPGNSWALDFRYAIEFPNRVELYVESAPLLSIAGEYEFVFVNFPVWKRLGIGAETENVHKAGQDSIGAGPRMSLPLASIGEYKLALGATYQFRYREADIPRLYIVLNRRFKRN